MKYTNKIPRILCITERKGRRIGVAFNNGEYRVINFDRLFDKWDLQKDPFQSRLLEEEVFSSVVVEDGTLKWPGLKKTIQLSNGMEMETVFDLDPVVLYRESDPDEERNKKYQIGSLLKKARLESGLTQEELAKRSGTTKNYISRIENNQSDIELGTLMKIVEIGLGKRLQLSVQ